MTSWSLESLLPIVIPRPERVGQLAKKAGSPSVPERGDVVWLTFDPQADHEKAGLRPAVVLSPVVYNRKARLAVFAPVTNHVKGSL